MIALCLAAAVASPTFQEDFPQASTMPAQDGRHLRSAAGFKASGLGNSPAAAATAFLARYGAAFAAGPPFEVILLGAPGDAAPGAVRFERRIARRPVFDGEIVVGTDAENAVVLVNAADVPIRVSGRARISRAAAIRAARAAVGGLSSGDEPQARRGFKAVGLALRPVWRVELGATKAGADLRTDVDAQTGKVLSRVDLRSSAPPPQPRQGR